MKDRAWIVEFKSKDGQSHTWFNCATRPEADRWYNEVVKSGLIAALYRERGNKLSWGKTI